MSNIAQIHRTHFDILFNHMADRLRVDIIANLPEGIDTIDFKTNILNSVKRSISDQLEEEFQSY